MEVSSGSEIRQFCAPGFGMPLDELPSEAFDHAQYGLKKSFKPLTTLREFTMMKLMDEFTDKPGWEKKVFDREITAKWAKEASLYPGINDVGVTQRMVKYVIAELQYKAKIFEETQAVAVYDGDVVKSDTIIPESLRQSLIDAIKPLEDVQAKEQDWHPHSGDKVLDLVHPSLFPLVYGRTRITSVPTDLENCIERSGAGSVSVVPKEIVLDDARYSTKFQWLPCEVDITNSEAPKITSYINNLHPHKHKDLYAILEKIIGYAIPLWSISLAPCRLLNDEYEEFSSGHLRIHCEAGAYHPVSEIGAPHQQPDEDDEEYDTRRREWIRRLMQPDVYGNPEPPVERMFGIQEKFAETGLQVIVQLENIQLTPERPAYDGGSWHIEGQLNEHICAIATYCYDSANIASSSISFRQRILEEDVFEIKYGDHDDWFNGVFGVPDDAGNPSMPSQKIGSIRTTQGRLVTFPNILRHRVKPFRLEDSTRPGHRKILTLFLVDPHIKIISTKHVPCQRFDWWKGAIEEATTRHNTRSVSRGQSSQARGAGFADLPKELKDLVYEYVEDMEGFPMSMDEARVLREELMNELNDLSGENITEDGD